MQNVAFCTLDHILKPHYISLPPNLYDGLISKLSRNLFKRVLTSTLVADMECYYDGKN